MYLVTNGKIVLEDQIIDNHELLIQDGKIAKIAPKNSICKGNVHIIDAQGGFIAPGFIDIHSDYIEHMVSPRPSSVLDFKIAIREVEKQLVNQGITTMFHSLSLYKESLLTPKKIRTSENVKKLIKLISETAEGIYLIHHKFHARYELDNFDDVQYLLEYIRQHRIHLLSFMDHTPGQGQYRDLVMYKETIKGYENISDQDIDSHIKKSQEAEKLDLSTIHHIAKIAQDYGVAIASHDDDSIEKLDLVKEFGTIISEFPITLEVAKAAKERQLYTLAGAPNVLMGGSHSGNLSAAEAIQAGYIDILCSDYYPASMLHAIFMLHNIYGQDLAEMFKLVTINPAKAVGIANQYGSIAEGKQADVVIINLVDTNYPIINTVLVDGNLVSQLNYFQGKVAI